MESRWANGEAVQELTSASVDDSVKQALVQLDD